jgi:hypothetical protein
MDKGILFENEKIIKSFSPKLISFFSYYIPYIYLSLIGLILFLDEKNYIDLFSSFDNYPLFIKNNIELFLFLILLIIPSIIYGLYKISFKMVFLFSLIGISIIILQYYKYPKIYSSYISLLIGFLGIFYTDYSRKQYKYHITNFRIILEHKAFRYVKRELLYDRIQDLSVQQGILGKIFKYGNIIPTSSSGIGTGTDTANISAGVGIKPSMLPSFGIRAGGEKGVIGFRARPNNCLYGIHEPENNVTLISKFMFQRNEVTKLDELTEIMKEIRDKSQIR